MGLERLAAGVIVIGLIVWGASILATPSELREPAPADAPVPSGEGEGEGEGDDADEGDRRGKRKKDDDG